MVAWGRVSVVLQKEVRRAFSDKMTSEQRPGRKGGVGAMRISVGRAFQAEGTASAGCPEAGMFGQHQGAQSFC